MKTKKFQYIISAVLVVAIALVLFLTLPKSNTSTASSSNPISFIGAYGQPVDPLAANDGIAPVDSPGSISREEHDRFQAALDANKKVAESVGMPLSTASFACYSSHNAFGMPGDPWIDDNGNWKKELNTCKTTNTPLPMEYTNEDRDRYQITEPLK